MREKVKTKRFRSYHLQHLDRIEEFLEKQAEDGWIVYKHYGGMFSFKKEQPRKIRYYVEVFEKEKWNKSARNAVNQAYVKECEKKGWTFVDADSKFQILCTEDRKAVKPRLIKSGKIESIYNSNLKDHFYILLCMLFMSLFNMCFSFTGMVKMLSSLSQLLYVATWAILSLYLIGYMVSQKLWKDRALRSTKGSEVPDNPSHKWMYIGFICALVVLTASIVGFFIESHTYSSGNAFKRCLAIEAIVAMGLVAVIVRDRQASWKAGVVGMVAVMAATIGIYIVASQTSGIFKEVHTMKTYEAKLVYEDTIPITLESLGVEKKESVLYSNYHEVYGEFLIKVDYYSEEPVEESHSKEPALCYSIYRTRNGYLKEQVLQEECFKKNEKTSYEEIGDCGGTEKNVYKKKLDTGYYEYVFVFDKQIIKMNINVELDKNQLQRIGTL